MENGKSEEPKKLSQEEMKRIIENKEILSQETKPTIETPIADPYLESARKMKELTGIEGLGSAGKTRLDDGVNADMILGWMPIIIEDMPSAGIFYSPEVKINVRAAKAAEIRQWSTLNDRNMYDVEDKLNHIL